MCVPACSVGCALDDETGLNSMTLCHCPAMHKDFAAAPVHLGHCTITYACVSLCISSTYISHVCFSDLLHSLLL